MDALTTYPISLASVLVIDDEEVVGSAVCALLEAEGFRAVPAQSAEEALALSSSRHFDVAIVDVIMPGMDGVQTAAALREAAPDIEIIFLTGKAAVKPSIMALRQEDCEFLLKPIGMADLRPALLRALERRTGRITRVEAQARSIIESSHDAIVLADRAGMVWDMNPQAERVFGLTRREARGRNLVDFAVPARFINDFRGHLKLALEEGRDPLEGYREVCAQRQNSEEFPFELATTVIETPQGKMLSTCGRDLTSSHRAQRVARETEAKLRAVFNGVETGVLLIDPLTHQVVDVNPLALKMIGSSRDATLGAECHCFVCPAQRGQCPVTDLGQQVDSSEKLLLTVGGREIPIIKTVRPVVVAGRRLLLESFVDISARKRAEDALRESEDCYRDLVENSFIMIGTHDLQGRILSLNRAAARFFEAPSADALAGHALASFVPPELLPKFEEYLKTVIRDGHAEGLMPFRTPSGKAKIVEYKNTLRRQDPHQPVVRWTCQDVTQKIAAEKMQLFLSQLVESSKDSIIGYDLDAKVVTWNRGAMELYQYSAKEMIGQSSDRLQSPATWEGWLEIIARIRRGEFVAGFETVRIRKDGTTVDVSVSVSPIVDANDRITGFASISQDITGRKEVEEQTRRLQNAALESAYNGIVIADRGGRIMWANPAFSRLTGYPIDEALGHTLRILKSGFHNSDFYARLWQTILAGKVWQGEIVNRRKDGSLYSQEMTITPVPDRAGEITHFVAIMLDITERKQAEQAFAQERDLLRSLMDNVPDAIYFKDRASRFLRINKALADGFGLGNPVLAIGRTDFEFYTSEHAEQAFDDEREIINTGKAVTGIEEKETWPDGRVTWVSTTKAPLCDAGGNIVGTVGISRDITGRKEEEQQTLLQTAALESAANGIAITNREGVLLWVNPAFTRLTGYTASDALGQTLRILKSGQHDGAFYRNLWQTIASGEIWRGEIVNRRKDGVLYTEDMTITPVRSRSGTISHFVAIKQDTTERRRAEEMEKAKEAAEAATQIKSQFLANMSHEIRTPLNGVIGMSKVLLDTELTPAQRRYAQVACTCGQTLLALINDILDFSKIEASKLSLEVVDFDLRCTIEQTVEILALPASKKGLELICMMDPEIPSQVRGDPARLRQVILNLAGNAIKFTAEGEVVIRICLDLSDEKSITLRCAVQDTGLGIPKERASTLFSPFVQGDRSTTRKFGGTGLGLAISKELVALMGGQIGVESDEGQGATFWFTAVLQKQEKAVVAETDALSQLESVKVLVVDDNATNRRAIGAILESWGCRWYQASDGTQVLATLEKAARIADPFEVVLVDAEMPGITGEELIRRLAANPQLARTKVLSMTNPHDYTASRFAGRGFQNCISKPVMGSHLREALREILGIASARVGTACESHGERSTSVPTVDGARILVAEDIESNQEVAMAILSKLGCHADIANNGAEALAALKSGVYDLILMDCEMPEMDGYDATRRIRELESREGKAHVPILAVTAHASAGDEALCKDAGMDDYLSKPIEPQKLVGALQKWLSRPPRSGNPHEEIPPSPQPAEVIFDEAAMVGRLMGDRALAETVVTGFLLDAPKQLSCLRERLEAGDAEESRRRAHGLKGASATVSAPKVRAIALEIENAAKVGELERALQLFPRLVEEFKRLRHALDEGGWAGSRAERSHAHESPDC